MKVIYDGKVQEVLTIEEANAIAEGAGLDLIEVSPNTYKVMDYGKYRYEQKKKNKQNAQIHQQCKELQISLCIGPSDLQRKIDNACKWLTEGNNVRVTMRLRGRLATKEFVILSLFNQVIDAAMDKNLLMCRPTLKKTDSANAFRSISVLMNTCVHPSKSKGDTDGQ